MKTSILKLLALLLALCMVFSLAACDESGSRDEDDDEDEEEEIRDDREEGGRKDPIFGSDESEDPIETHEGEEPQPEEPETYTVSILTEILNRRESTGEVSDYLKTYWNPDGSFSFFRGYSDVLTGMEAMFFTYDENGRVSFIDCHMNSGSHSATLIWDKEGNLVGCTVSEDRNNNADHEYTFDTTGLLMTSVHHYRDGDRVREYIYDEDRRLINEIVDDNGVQSIYYYTYDEAGQLVCYEGISGSEMLVKYEYAYTDGVRTYESLTTYSNGYVSLITIQTFDTQGNMLRTDRYTGGSEYPYSSSWINYTYDEQGRKITSHACSNEGESEYNYAYIYDEKGQLVETRDFHFSAPFGSDLYTYDEAGRRLTHTACLADGTPATTKLYTYTDLELTLEEYENYLVLQYIAEEILNLNSCK